MVKNLPASAGDGRRQVQSLGQKDPLEEEMATLFCILVGKIPWTEDPGRQSCVGLQRVEHD